MQITLVTNAHSAYTADITLCSQPGTDLAGHAAHHRVDGRVFLPQGQPRVDEEWRRLLRQLRFRVRPSQRGRHGDARRPRHVAQRSREIYMCHEFH